MPDYLSCQLKLVIVSHPLPKHRYSTMPLAFISVPRIIGPALLKASKREESITALKKAQNNAAYIFSRRARDAIDVEYKKDIAIAINQ